MRWMLNAAGQPTHGLRGALRIKGLVAVWVWTLRAFERDESEDLSATMATLDTALARAHAMAGWLSGERASDPGLDAVRGPRRRGRPGLTARPSPFSAASDDSLAARPKPVILPGRRQS